jgi:hypothetical protein
MWACQWVCDWWGRSIRGASGHARDARDGAAIALAFVGGHRGSPWPWVVAWIYGSDTGPLARVII